MSSSLKTREKDFKDQEHRESDDDGDKEEEEEENTSRPKRDFEEEWFALQSLYQQWREKEPQNHVLYDKAVALVAPNNSLQYYQGVYHTLCALHPVLELVMKPGFTSDPQSAMTEILQLQTGFTIGKILEKWPQHLIPKIIDKGNPRAKRSTYKDKD